MVRLGIMMRRMLHTPRGMKNIPIPRDTTKISEIRKFVEPTEPQNASAPQTPKFVKSLLPETTSPDTLKPSSESPVWYSVERSRAGNLPVYTDYNNAGGVWTEVRKVAGNVSALRNDLKILLGVNKSEIWIKDSSKTIVVKGNRSSDIKRILNRHF